MIEAASAYGTQSLTIAIPLGFFIVMLVLGFFQRHATK